MSEPISDLYQTKASLQQMAGEAMTPTVDTHLLYAISDQAPTQYRFEPILQSPIGKRRSERLPSLVTDERLSGSSTLTLTECLPCSDIGEGVPI